VIIFCILMIYPSTILNSLISSKSVFADFMRLFSIAITSSENRDLFHLTFQTVPFICLITIMITFSTILSNSNESRHLYLFLILEDGIHFYH
jgi:hypothetical protein